MTTPATRLSLVSLAFRLCTVAQLQQRQPFSHRYNMGGIGLLHAGYNAKADKGVTACLDQLLALTLTLTIALALKPC